MKRRRALAVLFLSLVFAVAVYAAIANAHKGQFGDWSSGTSWTVTVTSTTLHNLATVECDFDASLSVSSLVDNAGGGSSTYTDSLNDVSDTGAGWKAVMWYAKDLKAGATVVTVTLNGTPTFGECFDEEWSGTDNSAPLDQKNNGTGNSTTTQPSSGNVTPSVNNELIIGFIIPNTGTVTKATAFTIGTQPSGSDLSEYLLQGTASTLAATGTMSANDRWTAQVLTFKPSGGGAVNHNAVPFVAEERNETNHLQSNHPAIVRVGSFSSARHGDSNRRSPTITWNNHDSSNAVLPKQRRHRSSKKQHQRLQLSMHSDMGQHNPCCGIFLGGAITHGQYYRFNDCDLGQPYDNAQLSVAPVNPQ